jgi:hypothetical protein
MKVEKEVQIGLGWEEVFTDYGNSPHPILLLLPPMQEIMSQVRTDLQIHISDGGLLPQLGTGRVC